jgi:hypothetical protein
MGVGVLAPNTDSGETSLRLDFHTIPQVYGQLSNVSKRVLVCHNMIHAENFRCGVLHQVDRGQCEG